MNFFNKKTTWTNMEFIPLKLCIASIYVLIGAYFHTFFSHYKVPIIVLFVVTVLWTLTLFIKKMKKEN